MDRRHLEYSLAVAEQGCLTRAAVALSIAQPSLSHAIALLERDLGSQPFDRDGRGSRPTPQGRGAAGASVHLVWREGRLSPLAQHFVDVATGGPTDGGGP